MSSAAIAAALGSVGEVISDIHNGAAGGEGEVDEKLLAPVEGAHPRGVAGDPHGHAAAPVNAALEGLDLASEGAEGDLGGRIRLEGQVDEPRAIARSAGSTSGTARSLTSTAPME